MNVFIYYFEQFCEFESVFACMFCGDGKVTAIAQEKRLYKGEAMLNHMPDLTLAEVNADDIDLLIIPGGNPENMYKDKDLEPLLLELNRKNKRIAGICAGSFTLAKYGLLNGKRCTGNGSGLDKNDKEVQNLFANSIIVEEDVVTDGNITTATGQAYVEFASELEFVCGISSREQIREDYKWWKNPDSNWKKKLYE